MAKLVLRNNGIFYIRYREMVSVKNKTGTSALKNIQRFVSTGIRRKSRESDKLAEEVFKEWNKEFELKKAYSRLGISVPVTTATIGELWESYKASLEGTQKRPLTIKGYHGSIKRLESWMYNHKGGGALSELSRSDIEKFLIARVHEGEKTMSGANRDLRHIKVVFNWGAVEGLLPSGLCSGIKKFKVTTKASKILTDSEIIKMFKVADELNTDCNGSSRRAGLLLRLAYFHGFRPGEGHALLYDQVSFENQTVRLVDVPEIDFRIKRNQERTVRLYPDVLAMIKELGPIPDSPFITGYQSNPDEWRADWDKIRSTANLRGFPLRHLRNNFALRFTQLTKSERLARIFMGHSSETETLVKHYLDRRHLWPASKIWDKEWIADLRDNY